MGRHRTTSLTILALLLALLVPGEVLAQWAPTQPGGGAGGANEWNTGTCTRIGDSSFSVDDNAANLAQFAAGRPIRYGDVAGTWNYGMVTAVADAGATLTITIGGAPMDVAHDALCQWGLWGLIREISLSDPGQFADAADTTLLRNDLLMFYRWRHGRAYLVRFSVLPTADDTGAAQPRINVDLAGANPVSTSNGNAGLAVNDAAWQSTVVDISTANYDVDFGDTIEVRADANGTNDDAVNLSVQMIFVLEGKS